MLPEPPLISGRASTARRGLTGMTKPAPTRLASASRAAKRARVTSGPPALARARASGRDRESGAAAYTGRVTKQLETTAHVTQTRDARARLKRNFKAEPPENGLNDENRRAVRCRNRREKRGGKMSGLAGAGRARVRAKARFPLVKNERKAFAASVRCAG